MEKINICLEKWKFKCSSENIFEFIANEFKNKNGFIDDMETYKKLANYASLRNAVISGNFNNIMSCVKAGADPSIENGWVLHYLIQKKKYDTLKILLEYV